MKPAIVISALVGLFLSVLPASAATIQQTVQFDNVTPARLYQIYLSSKEHSAFTDAPAEIDARVGGKISIFGGKGSGTIFQLVPGTLIAQSWRSSHFQEGDLDSTLILAFRSNDAGAEIQVVQANVPDSLFSTINTGWNLNYWVPLRDYLKANPSGGPEHK